MRDFFCEIRNTTVMGLMLMGASAMAQMTPVGTWHSFDEKTGAVKSEIVIEESATGLRGYVSKLLKKDADQKREK